MRTAYYAAMLPQPKNEREAVAAVLAVMRNVSVPFGAPYAGFGIYNTEYRTAMNLSAKRYYFELTTSPDVVWADLDRFKLSPGQRVMVLDPYNVASSGDVTGKFRKASATDRRAQATDLWRTRCPQGEGTCALRGQGTQRRAERRDRADRRHRLRRAEHLRWTDPHADAG